MNLTDMDGMEILRDDQAEFYTFHITVPWIGFTLFVAFLPVLFIILIIIFYKFYTRCSLSMEDDERMSRCSSGSSTLMSALSTSSLKLRKEAVVLLNKQSDPVLKRNSSYTSNQEARFGGLSKASSLGQSSCGSECDEESRICLNTACKSILHHHHGLHQHHVKFQDEVRSHSGQPSSTRPET